MPQSQSFPVTAFRTKVGGYQKQPILGAQDEILVGAKVPANYEATAAGQAYRGANQAAVTTSAALATTYVGICLSNPAANTKNLVLIGVAGEFEVAPAAITSVGLIAGYAVGGVTVHTTPLSPVNAFLNGAASVAKLDSACTLVGTPFWADWLGVGLGTTANLSFEKKYDGSIIIPPGGYVAVGTGIAGPASGFRGSFSWIEL